MAAKEVGGVDLLVTLQKARIAPRTGVALRLNRYLDRIRTQPLLYCVIDTGKVLNRFNTLLNRFNTLLTRFNTGQSMTKLLGA